ncbi:hypothetical protein EST38_g1758 [Candolleomyces aberdarensis]|uniref:Uncharacterized protein n=1 Tax=Candolleomyces aberdarensis TaxID=2316362 RepID=A0A4Q2DU35_9AGAR|nr:hypothetical protein EST38_g1758 [Candolleomyces aberdarensis]
MVDALDTLSPNPRPRPWDTIRSLALTFVGEWEDSPDPAQSAFCCIPPSVTSLQLHLPSSTDIGDAEDIPLHLPHSILERLTSFSITCDWEGNQLPMVLQHCVKVEDLKINFKGDRCCEWYDVTDDTIQGFIESGLVLPKLRTLCLQEVKHQALDILYLLKTPKLTSLAVEFSRYGENVYDHSFPKTLTHFITERSGCEATFRRLHLDSFECEEGVLKSAMRALPSATHLTLNYPKVHSIVPLRRAVLLSELYEWNVLADGKVLPNLESLQLLNLDPKDHDDIPLYGISPFLSSRRAFEQTNTRDDEDFFIGPPDTLKEFVITFEETSQRLSEHKIDLSHEFMGILKSFA